MYVEWLLHGKIRNERKNNQFPSGVFNRCRGMSAYDMGADRKDMVTGVDKALVMDKLFRFIREFPEFEYLADMEYDERNGLVRAKIGITEKVIPIKDDSNWMGIAREVLTELEKEKLWNEYLDTMNGKQHHQNPSRRTNVIAVGANCGRETGCGWSMEGVSAMIAQEMNIGGFCDEWSY